MQNSGKWKSVLWAPLLLLVVGGCQNASKTTKEKTEQPSATGKTNEADLVRQISQLKTLGTIWHRYHDQNGRGPENWEEILVFSQNNADLMQLRDSGCVVNGWGIRFADARIGISNFVLAYTPEAKQDRGPILLIQAIEKATNWGRLSG